MKKTAKIFLIIGVILAAISVILFAILGIVYLNPTDELLEELIKTGVLPTGATRAQLVQACAVYGVVFIVFAIYDLAAIIIHAITLSKMKSFTSKGQVIPFGVLNIVFGLDTLGFIAGILLLCLPNEQVASVQE